VAAISLRTWICSIVHHRALDRLRGRSGRTRLELPIEQGAPETTFSDTWDQVAQSLERDHIAGALDELPAEQREVIEMAYFGGYTQHEISERLSLPLGTVKGRTRLALRKLRATLETSGWLVR
jgi:RNA polymerase sigma-70 factor (ECF subfamily)